MAERNPYQPASLQADGSSIREGDRGDLSYVAVCVGMGTRSPEEAAANAERLAACWNALAGISTDALDGLLDEVRGVLAPFRREWLDAGASHLSDIAGWGAVAHSEDMLLTVGDFRRLDALLAKLERRP